MRGGKLLTTLALCLTLLWSRASAEPVSLYEGALKLELPAVLGSLEGDQVQTMFASSPTRPQVVFVTPDVETRVAFTYLVTPFTPDDIEPTRVELTEGLQGRAEVAWHRNETVILNGTPWFRLDYDLTAKQPPTREILLGTSLRGKLLFVMIVTPEADLELLSPDLEALIASLQTSDS